MRSLFDLCVKALTRKDPAKLIELSKHIIDWCEKESRTFLKMKIEKNLAELLFH